MIAPAAVDCKPMFAGVALSTTSTLTSGSTVD